MARARKGRVKSQHFVPRCLLRRFSRSEKTTSVFVIGSTTFVETAGIKTQCAADYYYGHDQIVESSLAQLESAFSAAIGDLSIETIESMTNDETAVVKSFVHIQSERTPAAGQVWQDTYLDLGKQLYAAYAKANGLSDDDVDRQAAGFVGHIMPVPGAHTVTNAVNHQSSIGDLEVKFIVGNGFMISDHPTLTLNLWRDEHRRFRTWPTLGGLAAKGFIYAMPVATDRMVVVYDAGTYQIGSGASRIAWATQEDVTALNTLQSINATQLLFDSTVVTPNDLIAALHIRNAIRAENGPGLLPLRPAGIPLSFLRIVDHEPYDDWDLAMLPTRPGVKLPDETQDDVGTGQAGL